jgi:hypothetical protein
MLESILGWRGQPILGVRSRRSGEFWARDWRDMVLDPRGAIADKARRPVGRASAWFSPEDLHILRDVHGQCSYAQSIRSEDTMTWAAFGPRVTDDTLAAILDSAFGAGHRGIRFDRRYWGDSDVTLVGDGACVVVEAKWGADLSTEPGSAGATSQLAARAELAVELAPDAARRGVLVVVPNAARYPWAHTGTFARYFEPWSLGYRSLAPATALGAHAITWEQILDVIEDRQPGSELAAYLRWRLWHVPRASLASRTARARLFEHAVSF